MSDTSTTTDTNTSTTDGNATSGSTSTAGDEFTPITSQEELDRAIGPRLERERSKFADAVAKAAKYDEADQASKSELEKAQERAQQAELAAAEAKAEGLRFKIAAKHGISTEDADLFLTGQDEVTLEAQAKRLADREADRKKHGAAAPGEGRSSTSTTNDMSAFTRDLFAGGD